MTRKQYACIKAAQELIAQIQKLAYDGDVVCGGLYAKDTCYEIDILCRKWLDDFKDVDPAFYKKSDYVNYCKHGARERR